MILLTGSSGLIGHGLAQLLQANKIFFICLDPLAENSITEFCQTYKGSTLTPAVLDQIFGQHKIGQVVHLGMISTLQEIENSPATASESIIDGTVNLMSKMKEYLVPRLIFASTSMVYGDFLSDKAHETDQCQPKSLYGQLKLEAEKTIRAQKEVSYIIFRPTAVYGPKDQKDRVVARFLRLAKEDRLIKVKGAETKLDFTHVDDMAQAIYLLLHNKKIENKTYNISRGSARSLRELVDIIKRYYPQVRVDFQRSNVETPKRGALDISNARRDFGFAPQINLEEGIVSVIKGSPL
jgi:nucleoside-diphosphate-sugar epimerase